MMSVSPSVPVAMPVMPPCPLCARVPKKPKKCKPLNGVLVCPKCRNAFANRRQLAYIIDLVIWELAGIVPLYYLGLLSDLSAPGFSLPAGPGASGLQTFFTWIFPFTFYFKDGFKGMSPGKYICGVQVVDVATQGPGGFGRSFKRNLCLLVPLAPLIIAFLMMKGRRWGDGWAKTKVIWRKHAFKLPATYQEDAPNASHRYPPHRSPYKAKSTVGQAVVPTRRDVRLPLPWVGRRIVKAGQPRPVAAGWVACFHAILAPPGLRVSMLHPFPTDDVLTPPGSAEARRPVAWVRRRRTRVAGWHAFTWRSRG